MKAYLALPLLLTSLAIELAQSCTPHRNFNPISTGEVLNHDSVNLVVRGRFQTQVNTTEKLDRYVLRLYTQVDCVLRNDANVTVPRNISIVTVRRMGFNVVFRCIDYFYNILFEQPVVIMISPSTDEMFAGEFEFSTANLQGPYFYLNNTELAALMAAEGSRLQLSSSPEGVDEDFSGCSLPQVASNLEAEADGPAASSSVSHALPFAHNAVMVGLCSLALLLLF